MALAEVPSQLRANCQQRTDHAFMAECDFGLGTEAVPSQCELDDRCGVRRWLALRFNGSMLG